MFEQLFGSKTRAKLIKLFLDNPDRAFFVRELTRLTGSMINSVRRELQILMDLEIIFIEQSMIEQNKRDMNLPQGLNTKKFYKLNKQNLFHKELTNIFQKNDIVTEQRLTDQIRGVGKIYLAVLVGCFIKEADASTDVLLVTTSARQKMVPALKILKEKAKQDINFTIMDPDEYFLRKDIKDKFLFAIINNSKKIVLVDRIKELSPSGEVAKASEPEKQKYAQ